MLYTSIEVSVSAELVKVWALVKFLKEHEGVWYSPHEIRKELGSHIRTVYKMIRRLSERPLDTTYKSWRLDVAERGDRIFCVRMERDLEHSGNLVKAEVSEVDGNRTRPKISSKGQQKLRSLYNEK